MRVRDTKMGAGFRVTSGLHGQCRSAFRAVRAPLWTMLCVSLLFATNLLGQPALSFEARTKVLEHWLTEQVEYHAMPGVVVGVVDKQRLVWSAARGEGMASDTPLRMGSISKIFTSTAIVALRDQGKLHLDDLVKEHLPWFELALVERFGEDAMAVDGTRYKFSELDGSTVTVRHLLTHTAGLPREAGVPYWTDHVFPDSAQLAEVVVNQHALWPPGREYQYSNLGMGLLGEIVSRASGMRFADYLEETLFSPLGMGSSTAAPTGAERVKLAPGYMRRMPDGSRDLFDYYDTEALAGAANVVSTLEDMARFASMHLANSGSSGSLGATDGEPVVEPASIEEMHSVQWASQQLSRFRGLGFSLSERDGARIASHGGWIAGHRSHLILLPEQQIAVIAMVNADDVSPSFFAYQALDVLRPAIEAQRTTSSSVPSRGPMRPRGFGMFEGTYSDPWGSYYEAMDLDGQLYFYEHSYPPSNGALSSLTWLKPDGAGGFEFGKARDRVRFELSPERDDDTSGTDDRTVLRVLRRSDYLFPINSDGRVTVTLP